MSCKVPVKVLDVANPPTSCYNSLMKISIVDELLSVDGKEMSLCSPEARDDSESMKNDGEGEDDEDAATNKAKKANDEKDMKAEELRRKTAIELAKAMTWAALNRGNQGHMAKKKRSTVRNEKESTAAFIIMVRAERIVAKRLK